MARIPQNYGDTDKNHDTSFSGRPRALNAFLKVTRRLPAARHRLSRLVFLAFPATPLPHTLSCSCADKRTLLLRRHEKWVTISGERTMDDIPYQDFFLHPSQVLHRQYEALRTVFVEHQPLAQVAQQFGYSYGSLRNLVAEFRTRCRAGQATPFSPSHPGVGHTAPARTRHPVSRRPLPPLTTANSPSPRDVACAPAWPGSSCSCRC
jgi:hypothetical protein